jgi:hypothetical protein
MDFDLRHIAGYEYIFAALVFAAVLSAYMVGLHVWDHVRRRGLSCVWEYDKIQPHGGTHRWVCAECGETGFSNNRRAPVTCKKGLGGRTL